MPARKQLPNQYNSKTNTEENDLSAKVADHYPKDFLKCGPRFDRIIDSEYFDHRKGIRALNYLQLT